MQKFLYSVSLTLGVFGPTVYAQDTFNMSLQQLMDIEVTSVSRQARPLSNSPAAIYVVSAEDIKRNGATSIPQAIKDVPGLHVVQIDSQKWAVSSRGFNGRLNNKLLVLMDGRTLYSPVFSGVYWEVQDTLMADIDRIEIIRGSVAMWGANAVNGVINIVTKHTAETLGGYTSIGAGDYNQGFLGFRYGGKLNENITARGYAKSFKRDSLKHDQSDMDPSLHMLMMDSNADNAWTEQQAGGRIDMNLPGAAKLRLSSDVYQTKLNHVVRVPLLVAPYVKFSQETVDSTGWNAMAKYNKALSATSEYSFQSYFDYAHRGDQELFAFTTKIIDLEFQHQFQAEANHNFIWSLGFRHIGDEIDVGSTISTDHEATTTNLWSFFISDEITLVNDTLWLTLAARAEHNSYTGVEWQPNARLFWKLNDQHKLWSSVGYSVRSPARFDSNLNIAAGVIPPFVSPNVTAAPVLLELQGQDDFKSEYLLDYELGYRFSPTSTFSLDSTIFLNHFHRLRGAKQADTDLTSFPTSIVQGIEFTNSQEGHTHGLELSSQWLATNTLKFKLNYSYTNGSFSDMQTQNTRAPRHIGSLNAVWSVHKDVDVNATWRYVDNASILNGAFGSKKMLDSFHGVDLGVNWHMSPDVTLSAYGKNLFYGEHVEYESGRFQIPYRVEPSYYGKVTFKF